MNRRRLMALFAYTFQDGEPDFEEWERMFWKFHSCGVPHQNVNDRGMRRLLGLIDQFEFKEFTPEEISEMTTTLKKG